MVHKLQPKDIMEIRDLHSLTNIEIMIEAINENIGELTGALKVTVRGTNNRE